jgi:hypothetical protein
MPSTEKTSNATTRQRPCPSVDGVLRWMDLMETCEQLLLAGLRRTVGPDGDVAAAYRSWNARQMARRDRELPEMLSPARRLRKGHAD